MIRKQTANSGRLTRPLFAFVAIIIGVVLALIVQAVVVQVYVVPSGSMTPTFRVGDRVLVDKLSRVWRPLARGDVIVFDATDVWTPASNGRLIAKRVIGVPGDRVSCCDAQDRLLVNGAPVLDPFTQHDSKFRRFDVRVPAGRLWVMGDARAVSVDSRSYMQLPGRGSVPIDHVIGRVTAVVWPWNHAGILGTPEGGS